MKTADFRIDAARSDDLKVSLQGDWTATSLGRAGDRLARAVRGRPVQEIDDSELGRFDTTGAYALMKALGGQAPADAFAGRDNAKRVLDLVKAAPRQEAKARVRENPGRRFLAQVGGGVVHLGDELYQSLGFQGHLAAACWAIVRDPRRIRWAAWISLMERAGLDALPIVAVTTFFIGAVVAFLGADLLSQFGAGVFAVELIGIAVLREFAVVITAVLLAGRSASSFAAEIGSMKMNQEVDAMETMGVDPFEALVIPRIAALVVMTPLLTFVADASGLLGGALVTWWKLGLGPAFFLQRITENVGQAHFWIGLSKAPVFAIVVAAIGCRQGLAVLGDVETLGRRVTAAVVQAIFAIIMLDAAFALLYLEAGL